MSIDQTTREWILNASDKHAAANGCRFDLERAQHVCDFFENHLVLYEGEFAGDPFKLMPWQRECLMRAFGWVKFSDDWNREIRRFRRVFIWLPKKNGKSPLAAGVGLYLLTADGEQGQKVFSVAHDGKQAKVVHTHACEMVKRSPMLKLECKINASTGRIAHLETTSFYDILPGDNIPSQEGLNGSAIIDEAHVVNEKLTKVLKYMGASRSEPMQFAVSTAGNNPDGWGKKQWDRGEAVANGTVIDEHFLHVAYAAPQNATDEECRSAAMWQKANPSWGRTIRADEMRTAAEEAQGSLTDWLTFKMYRLNVWQESANPWLSRDSWTKCARSYTLEDLRGQDCWAGLDLSKTRDMSALMLVFANEEEEGKPPTFRLWPMFWLPEEVAKARNHEVRFIDWAANKHLTLIPGPTIDQRKILADIKDVLTTYELNLLEVRYDATYAEELTGDLTDPDILGDVAAGERVPFKQSTMEFAGPTADFERLIIAGELHHPNHPVLNWQAGHVQVKTDTNNNKRPVKPGGKDDVKKIDGIVAGIMGVSAATSYGPQSSFYDDHGLEIG